ncbi:hypothetical protein [Streptomyces sp. SAT1]|uniref:hypothetical protein n=1 Tax=Streptomyces sp. SAT1 TaxID=1849967 RepID=UPI000AA73907|nr:hypothetical protein [Streptomyces sp. SAT1]
MNLAWIAAVLQPHTVAIHPNFSDEEYSREPAGQLAALLIGGDWGISTRDLPSHDAAVSYAEKILRPETVSEGAEGLMREALSHRSEDMARSAALALLAAFATAEMEEYDACDSLLSEMIDLEDRSPSGRLVKAILTQQRALRRRDAGLDYIDDVFDAARLLEDVNTTQLPAFAMGPGASSTSEVALEKIIYSMKRSTWSLTPYEYDTRRPFESFPGRMNRLKMPLSERMLRISTERASVYARQVRNSFTAHFTNATVVGRSRPDLFHETLAVELLGHGEVYRARKDLATLRLVQYAEGADVDNLHVSIRLLRQAGATRELESALERLRAAGPLSALSRDARQILLRRSTPQRLRVPELVVLRAAAELMSPSEAEQALEVVLASASAGGPPNVVGASQHRIDRCGVAWRTASALASTCHKGEAIAALLLREVRDVRRHTELLDSNVAKAINELPWEDVPDSIRSQWGEWLADVDTELFGNTAEAVALALGLTIPHEGGPSGLNEIATRLNTGLRNDAARLTDTELLGAVDQVSATLNEMRESVTRGMFSLGTRSAADIAAMLLVEYPRASHLWESLAPFLISQSLPRLERTAALDRLAREKPQMPNATRVMFSANIDRFLESSDAGILWDDPVVPYPAALRFLISYNLLDDARIIASLARLSGHTALKARREAPRTLESLAGRATAPWLLPLALQMSHESDILTKSHAARFLSHVATDRGEFAAVATARLGELLTEEDGLLTPLFVLRELENSTDLPEQMAQAISRLHDEHPSWRVRAKASKLLAGWRS